MLVVIFLVRNNMSHVSLELWSFDMSQQLFGIAAHG